MSCAAGMSIEYWSGRRLRQTELGEFEWNRYALLVGLTTLSEGFEFKKPQSLYKVVEDLTPVLASGTASLVGSQMGSRARSHDLSRRVRDITDPIDFHRND
ncbi:hypothetical protein BY996DRAFT_6425260 [Phakopsora pachyrhizi]|nr:hypothetical protein BY996DRAFT_6425260 [Phakopsora pachyrhizi]